MSRAYLALKAHTKDCEDCRLEAATGDPGMTDSLVVCETAKALRKAWRVSEGRNRAARERRQVYADLGLHRVVGALGGVYYE